MRERIDKPKGMLYARMAQEKFRLTRYPPSRDLEYFVERYWIVDWDLRCQEPYLQENLPHPTINLVFERGASGVYGVVSRGKFAYLLTGSGRVFGVKFRPGGFYPFLRSSVSALKDNSLRISEIFDVEDEAIEETILSATENSEMVELVETFLRARLPDKDENVDLVNRIVDQIIVDRELVRAEEVARRFNLTDRTLQRLFRRYVGVGPKWVIRRYRLQQAADRLAETAGANLQEIALDLGYFDQAHFIRDFKALIGVTPAEYLRQAGP